MLKHSVTRRLSPSRWASREQRSQRPLCRRSELRSYRPVVEVLEDRTLLSFITAPSYAAGIGPSSVAVGDLNGDGHLDLAVATSYSYTGSMLIGSGYSTLHAL